MATTVVVTPVPRAKEATASAGKIIAAGFGAQAVQAHAARASRTLPLSSTSNPADTLTWSVGGIAAYAAFLVAAGAYFYVRSAELLAAVPFRSWAHVSPYALAILAIEAVGASSVLLYGLCIVRRLPGAERGAAGPVPAGTNVHVLVPCYTETLDIVADTVWAAAEADLPPGARATVYLCDDGDDPAKAEWVASLKTDRVRYVVGRARAPGGEANGKACNLNHALGLIFPPGAPVAPTDAVAVFDADQVAHRAFFVRTLPALAASPDTALVTTPQKFANVDDEADIFNHSNRHFWEVMIPGLTAWGMVVCTGTNLVLRADVLVAVGGFPTSTVTEDYLLGMQLKMAGYRARYIPDYLATGEAPEDGSIFHQRSRWCKGHLQALFSRDCPMLQSRLSLMQKLLYSSGAWAYVAAALTTPALAAVPVLALTADVLPFTITPRLACAFVPYLIAVHGVVYWCESADILHALWFRDIATRILWWTYAKALANTALWALGFKRRMAFKTTTKAGVRLVASVSLAGEAGSVAGVGSAASVGSVAGVGLAAPVGSVASVGLAAPVGSVARVASVQQATMITEPSRHTWTIKAVCIRRPNLVKVDVGRMEASLTTKPATTAPSSPALPKAGAISPAVARLATVPNLLAPMTMLAASAGAASLGWLRIAAGRDSASLDVAIAWALYNSIPLLLLAHYVWLGRGPSLRGACRLAMALCGAVLAGAVAVGYSMLPPRIRGTALGLGARYGGGGGTMRLTTGSHMAVALRATCG